MIPVIPVMATQITLDPNAGKEDEIRRFASAGPSPLGRGRERACCAHPENCALCIKVNIGPPKPGRRRQSPQEACYLRHLDRLGGPFTRYYGEVVTDVGTGYMFDRCMNADGTEPGSLRQLMAEAPDRWPRALLADLRDMMLVHGIVPPDISPDNLLLQSPKDGRRAVLVDGVANRDFVPLAPYSPAYARTKISRWWDRFPKRTLGLQAGDLRH